MKLWTDTQPVFKANFHTHTTRSDGHRTPEESMALYRQLGYDVLAITDHRTVTHPGEAPEGLLTIPGVELDLTLGHQAVHLLGIGVDDDIVAGFDPHGTPQQAIDLIRAHGGQAMLAHPAWSLNTPEFMAGLKGLCGVEIWNSVSDVPYNAARGDSSSLIDVAAALGNPMPLAANDDTHYYGAELGRGATMVQAAERTVPAILEALAAGRFYGTQGPLFEEIDVEDGCMHVRCTPAETVIFYSNMPWASRRTIVGHDLTEATYHISAMDSFVRCQIIDRDGRSAWSSPMKK